MKPSLNPLFSLLLLIALAASLTCRISIRRNFEHIEHEFKSFLQIPPSHVFNSTLLKAAALDIGETGLKQEIQDLLHKDTSKLSLQDGLWSTSSSPRRRFSYTTVKVTTAKLFPKFKKALRSWLRKRRYESEIMEKLVKLIKTPIDNHNGAFSGSKYKSCAVVGNSGILLKAEHGDSIDSLEVVIRVNNAETEQFKHQVGTKTNISFVNSHILNECVRKNEGCFCQPYPTQVPAVVYICQPLHLMDYAHCNSTEKQTPLLLTDGRFDVLCSRIVKYYSLKRFVEEKERTIEEWGPAHDNEFFHYSSGFQAVTMASAVCEQVSLFGFGKMATAKHHYHTNQEIEINGHDYEAEYALYRDLVNNTAAIPFISDTFKFPQVIIHQ